MGVVNEDCGIWRVNMSATHVGGILSFFPEYLLLLMLLMLSV